MGQILRHASVSWSGQNVRLSGRTVIRFPASKRSSVFEQTVYFVEDSVITVMVQTSYRLIRRGLIASQHASSLKTVSRHANQDLGRRGCHRTLFRQSIGNSFAWQH